MPLELPSTAEPMARPKVSLRLQFATTYYCCCSQHYNFKFVHNLLQLGNPFILPGATVATILMLGALHARRLYEDRKVYTSIVYSNTNY